MYQHRKFLDQPDLRAERDAITDRMRELTVHAANAPEQAAIAATRAALREIATRCAGLAAQVASSNDQSLDEGLGISRPVTQAAHDALEALAAFEKAAATFTARYRFADT